MGMEESERRTVLIWHGTASVELRGPGGRIVFDPFVTLPGADIRVPIEEYDGSTDIVVTHGHFDHIASIPEIVRRNPDVEVHCTRTPFYTLRRKGVPIKNLDMIVIGETMELAGFRIKAIQGRHAVLPKATPKRIGMILNAGSLGNLPWIASQAAVSKENGETVFYQIECPPEQDFDGMPGRVRTISLMGSLNLAEGVDYPTGSDVLVLPYNGWEDNFPPAVRVVERLRPKRVLLDHYDCAFPPLTTPVDLEPFLERYSAIAEPLIYGEKVRI